MTAEDPETKIVAALLMEIREHLNEITRMVAMLQAVLADREGLMNDATYNRWFNRELTAILARHFPTQKG